ncbi:MAG: hypothetical protein WBW84_13985 [Acidobacteriaceae bacterium]
MQAIQQPTGTLDHIQQWANNVADDLRQGTNKTGIGTLLKYIGAQPLESGESSGVADFMGSIPLGALRMIKGAAELPQPGKRWQGTKDVAGGAWQASQEPGFFAAPEVGEIAPEMLSKAGDAVASAAGAAKDAAGTGANAVRNQFSLKAVQEALQNAKASTQQELQDALAGIQNNWHGSVRDLLDSVGREAGVKPNPAQSLNDVAANLSAAIKAKASGLYKELDNAIGGTRFQTYDEQLGNVKRALRNSAGIDPDTDGRLVERINQLEDAKAAAMDQAKSAGVNPDLIHQANTTHRQAMALEDLSKHLRASMEGLRADVGTAATKAAPEALNPTKLSPRLNRMYNTGRLQQAVGNDHADELLEAAETAKQRAKDAASEAAQKAEAAQSTADRQASNVKLKRYVAATALGSIPGFELLRHLLGE